jgi:pyruvate formate lyase activating enzyme
MRTGLVFNIQRFSLHDGPGVRTTVFMKGCPLRCQWCHNPESQSPHPQFVRMTARCMRCERCSDEDLASPVVRGRDATDVECCPTGALQAVGETMTVDALVTEVLRDRLFFDESGGGVTFSGGEPLMQAAFVTDCVRRLQAEGVHTAVDTSGAARWTDLAGAAAHTDLWLYDVKLMDDARHVAATGASNRTILGNLCRLAVAHTNIWIRVPIIPGVNDDDRNLMATAAFVRTLPGVTAVTLLPYHATAAPKFARVGIEYTLPEIVPPDRARLDDLARHFRQHGLHTTIGGHA